MALDPAPYDRRVSSAPKSPPLPIIGLGAGTHAKSVLEAIRSAGRFEVAALIDDDAARSGQALLGFPISGPEALERLRDDGVEHAFAGVGGIGDSSARRAVFERLLKAGLELPPIVHASAVVSPWAELGRGAQVLAGALVNAGAEIGDDVILNTGAIVEHDCRIEPHAHIAPGAKLAGLATVGEGAHVGIGAVVIESVRVGKGALVGAGAVVIRDVPDGSRVAGVPAKPLD
jgi:sugar O-acyltransferase (sialic acid O-acetyltransferase NeuD family)